MDDRTYDRMRQLMKVARIRGLDPLEALDAGRALLTPERRKQLRLEALYDFRNSFLRWQPHEYLRRLHEPGPYTAAQMHQVIADYLLDFIELEAKGP